MFKNNIDHPTLLELWIYLFLNTYERYISFEFMRHTILFDLVYFYFFSSRVLL